MKNKSWIIISVVFLLSAFFLAGNFLVVQGDNLENAILDQENYWYKMKKAGERLSDVKVGDGVLFVVPFEHSIDLSRPVAEWTHPELNGFFIWLRQIKEFSLAVEADYEGRAVLSAGKISNYREEEGVLKVDNYLSNLPSFFTSTEAMRAYVSKFISDIKRDNAIYGTFIGTNFDYALVNVWYEEESFLEKDVFFKTAEFLEQREIGAIERFYKSDIVPLGEYADIMVSGWVNGRAVIFQGIVVDSLLLPSLGMIFSFIIAWLSLRHWKPAALTVLVIAVSLLWIRGSIGWAFLAGIPIKERVYIVVVYIPLIVQAISFCLHLLHAHRDNKGITSVRNVVLVTAVIAALNFCTMYTVGIRQIAEVGFLAAVGTFYTWALARWFLPAMLELTGYEPKRENAKNSRLAKIESAWSGFIAWLVGKNLQWLSWKYSGRLALAQIIVLPLIALAIVWQGGLEIRTKPLNYISGTLIERTAKFLNEEGRSGFDYLPVVVSPKVWESEIEPIYDPDFIRKVYRYQKKLEHLFLARQATSVIDTMSLLSQVNYGEDLPADDLATYDVLNNQISNDLDGRLHPFMWSSNQEMPDKFVIYLWTAMDDSNDLEALCEQVVAVAPGDVEVITAGKKPIWAATDEMMRVGMPLNEISSLAVIWLIVFLWMARVKNLQKCAGIFHTVRSWLIALVATLPFVFATAVMVIVMTIFNIPLDLAMACIFSMTVCAAIDFNLHTIHYCVLKSLEGSGAKVAQTQTATIKAKGEVVITDVVANSLCFAPLIISTFYPVQMIGVMMLLMMAATGYASLYISMALLPWCVKDRKEV